MKVYKRSIDQLSRDQRQSKEDQLMPTSDHSPLFDNQPLKGSSLYYKIDRPEAPQLQKGDLTSMLEIGRRRHSVGAAPSFNNSDLRLKEPVAKPKPMVDEHSTSNLYMRQQLLQKELAQISERIRRTVKHPKRQGVYS